MRIVWRRWGGTRMEKSAVKICCCGLKADDAKLQNDLTSWITRSGSWESRRRGNEGCGQWEWQDQQEERRFGRNYGSEVKKPRDGATDWSPDRRNDESVQRLRRIDWRVDNLKLFPWDKSNSLLFKEEKTTTPADKEDWQEMNQIVVQAEGIRDRSQQAFIQTTDGPKRSHGSTLCKKY